MPNYQNGKIYTLRSYQTDDIYIGSTTQSLAVRKGGHKKKYKAYLNGKFPFVTSFDVIRCDDCYIELLESFPCNNKSELCAREGHHIRRTDCLNKHIAGRTIKQWRDDNKEHNKKRDKEYRIKNIEIVKKKDKIKYMKNREKYIQKAKERYEKNKEHILALQKQKNNCVCGGKYTRTNKIQHTRTTKHIQYMETQQD